MDGEAEDYPKSASAEAVVRDCTYLATLARIYPACFCKGTMQHGIELEWLYGHDARAVRKNGRCCTRCNNSIIEPARLKAERDWLEAFYRRYPRHRPEA